MAATPKRKTSKGRRNRRRAHHALKPRQLQVSKQTGKLVPVGVVCKDNPEFKGVTLIKSDD